MRSHADGCFGTGRRVAAGQTGTVAKNRGEAQEGENNVKGPTSPTSQEGQHRSCSRSRVCCNTFYCSFPASTTIPYPSPNVEDELRSASPPDASEFLRFTLRTSRVKLQEGTSSGGARATDCVANSSGGVLQHFDAPSFVLVIPTWLAGKPVGEREWRMDPLHPLLRQTAGMYVCMYDDDDDDDSDALMDRDHRSRTTIEQVASNAQPVEKVWS